MVSKSIYISACIHMFICIYCGVECVSVVAWGSGPQAADGECVCHFVWVCGDVDVVWLVDVLTGGNKRGNGRTFEI